MWCYFWRKYFARSVATLEPIETRHQAWTIPLSWHTINDPHSRMTTSILCEGLKYIIDAMEYHIKETLRHSVTLYRRSPFMYACVWNIKYKHLLATKEYPRPIWKQKIRNYSRQEFIHYSIFFIFIKCSTFVGSGWSFVIFIPATTANDLRLGRIFYPRLYPLHLLPVLILEKEPLFSFWMFSGKQGN